MYKPFTALSIPPGVNTDGAQISIYLQVASQKTYEHVSILRSIPVTTTTRTSEIHPQRPQNDTDRTGCITTKTLFSPSQFSWRLAPTMIHDWNIRQCNIRKTASWGCNHVHITPTNLHVLVKPPGQGTELTRSLKWHSMGNQLHQHTGSEDTKHSYKYKKQL